MMMAKAEILRILIVVLGVGMVLLAAGAAKADSPPYGSVVSDSYIFRRVSDNSGYDISTQLTLILSTYDTVSTLDYDVDNDPDTNEVLFTFWNNESGSADPIDSSICDGVRPYFLAPTIRPYQAVK